MYLVLKLVHIVSVVAFLGNISTGIYWHARAQRTGDPKIIAHTVAAIIASDRYFTVPSVVLILLTGVAAALIGGFPIFSTDWIFWTLVLFIVSGVLFMAFVVPLQRQMLVYALSGAFDPPVYTALARRWKLWGLLSLATPLAGLGLMVLKPAW
jgi:uncharacterized membrane protein